ncbi:MAG: class I SAM-dependent methyltransferase [Bacilli bacterium]
MEEKNMTALVSCFARCYHYKNNKYRIFSDNIAERILSDEEYNSIAINMVNGIKFFNPNFVGTNEEALRWIVDNQLSPSVLGRCVFCEKSLSNAIKIGCREYLIFASGYDTFAYRNNIDYLKVFEIDKSEMIKDKIRRLDNNKLDYSKVDFIKCDFTNKDWINNIMNSNYDKNQISFNSLLGISYYLTKEEFFYMIKSISGILCNGSSIVFDYPTYEDSKEMQTNEKLASGANELMKSKYSYKEIEDILSENGLLIYEHLNNKEMTDNYFAKYNALNPNNKIIAPKGVCYCLAVKR